MMTRPRLLSGRLVTWVWLLRGCVPLPLVAYLPVVMILGLQPRCLAGEISYTREIQPIFAEYCFQCHGPDADTREADLRLDVALSATQSVIVPGAPAESELISRISSHDPDLRMPPSAQKQLKPEQIQLLRQWIAEGANYQRHWAFEPISESIVPPQVAGDRRHFPVDQFVVAKLERQGLQLSPPASKQQLIRRATFDLTGLPPTWEQVTEFVNDRSPDAFEKVVNRLLDSPAYGERWGRHWLDLARYADTHGGAAIGFQRFPFSYTYRDYVIEAFRAHLPFDQFVLQQLAADQLGLGEHAEELAALGFLTVGRQFRNPHNIIDDQIDVTTRGLMGLTVTCARCHDHKFDAISIEDYYSIYSIFASSKQPEELPVIGSPQQTKELEEYRRQMQVLQTKYRDMARDQTTILRGRLRMQVGLYLREIARGAPEPDLVAADVFSFRTEDLRPHVLKRWQDYLGAMSADDPVFGPWVQLQQLAVAHPEDFSRQCKDRLAQLQQQNGESSQAFHKLAAEAPRWNPRVLEALTAKAPPSMFEVADAYGDLLGSVHQQWLRSQIDAALEAVPGATPIPDEDERHLAINSPVNRQLRRHLYDPGTPTNLEDRLASRQLNRPINDNLNGKRGAIQNLHLNAAGSPPRAMALAEQLQAGPFHIFERGNPRQRGATVQPRFLSVLNGEDRVEFPAGQRRLALAKAIVDADNPLTRRVIVNWVWMHHFSQGIVRTPDDFGTRGEPPTHPELLDFLATGFRQHGWSLPWLHRQIMFSQTYQQAALERPSARNADPDNRLWWRMPRRRLDWESMRDAMLFASGELTTDIGDQREARFPFALFADPVTPKRSVYAFVNRDIVHPVRSTFDAANPSTCTAKRSDTTVPQQTLFVLNSDFVQDRAASLAKSVREGSRGDSDEEAIKELFRRTLAREPALDEISAAMDFVAAQDGDPSAAWQRFAQVLVASNEFTFLD